LINIKKKYNQQEVLKGINLEFNKDKIYVIKGVSGCGKTTLLNLIGCLDNDYSGDYEYEGNKVKELNSKQTNSIKSQIGYVFQSSLLLGNLSVMDNLYFIGADKIEIESLAKKLEIEQLLNKMPDQLSNGERQRISIARALLLDTKVLLCDEPTAALDAKRSNEIVKLLDIAKDGRCVIVSTHEDCFDQIADQVINIDYGEINNNKIIEPSINKKEIAKFKPNNMLKLDIKYALKKVGKPNILSSICFLVIFLLIFLGAGIRLHFSDSYILREENKYPSDIFRVSNDSLKKLSYYDQIVFINNYQKVIDNTFIFNRLPTECDTFRIPEAIEYGTYPSKTNEVIVNQQYIERKYKDTNYANYINKEISLEGIDEPLIISAILKEYSEEYLNAIGGYDNTELGRNPFIAIDEKVLSKYIEADPIKDINRSYYPNMKEHKYEISELTNGNRGWEFKLEEKMQTINMFLNIFFINVIIIMLIVFVFLSNMINLELFYRRKEIGYLQVFNVSKNRIKRILVFEHLGKIVIPLILSIIINIVISLIIKSNFNLSIALTPLEYLLIISIIIV
ncbi:MAG: ATP-binding cassette domain-containing protein, partial [Erysipelotrichaceae bacterium]